MPGIRPRLLSGGVVALGLAAVALTVFWPGGQDEDRTPQAAAEPPPAALLPDATEYHSLFVDPADSRRILVGTPDGVYESLDGGGSWQGAGLGGRDTIGLAPAGRRTVWAAGQSLLARSGDGGRTWKDVGLNGATPAYVRALAVDPGNGKRVYLVDSRRGLVRSADGGRTFTKVNGKLAENVGALALMPDGRLLAGDVHRGLLVSADGGKTLRPMLSKLVLGVAVNPRDPTQILAVGHGIYLSIDGGRTWSKRFPIVPYAAAVAWAPGKPRTAYVAGKDGLLYRSRDGGFTWAPATP